MSIKRLDEFFIYFSYQLGEVAGYLTHVRKPFDAFVGLGMDFFFRIEAGLLIVHLGLRTLCGGFRRLPPDSSVLATVVIIILSGRQRDFLFCPSCTVPSGTHIYFSNSEK